MLAGEIRSQIDSIWNASSTDKPLAAFNDFLFGRNLTSSQIEFIDVIAKHLTDQGYVDSSRLYASPFTDLNPLMHF